MKKLRVTFWFGVATLCGKASERWRALSMKAADRAMRAMLVNPASSAPPSPAATPPPSHGAPDTK